jgi:hypothetical protein
MNIVYIVKVKSQRTYRNLMNSKTLIENGFVDFIPLKGLPFSSLPNNQCSVIILADCSLTGKPTSDIIYIGKAKKPAKRVFGGYIGGYGGKATKKIHSALVNNGFMEKVAISWMSADNPKVTQKALLEDFKREHGEYPAWNGPKKASKQPQSTTKVATSRSSRKPAKSMR